MPWFDFFRRRPPIRDAKGLADFIDQNAAFLVQKGIYEYSRARAGHYSKVLFAEPEFKRAVEVSRWRAYPLGLAMVGEIVEGILASTDGDNRAQRLDALIAIVLSVFDRYPVPAEVGGESWSALRADLKRHLQQLALHPPKRAMDVPEPFAKAYFNEMPIEKKLRAPDFPSITGYLRVSLCNIHDEFMKRLDRAALPDLLRTPAAISN
jgi:hypothetical protein